MRMAPVISIVEISTGELMPPMIFQPSCTGMVRGSEIIAPLCVSTVSAGNEAKYPSPARRAIGVKYMAPSNANKTLGDVQGKIGGAKNERCTATETKLEPAE